VRFFQAANYYVLEGDVDGDGRYEKRLAVVSDHKGSWYNDWIVHRFAPPVRLRGLRLANISVNRPLMEMEIYERRRGRGAAAPPEPALAPGVPAAADGEAVAVPAPTPAESYLKGVVIEPWMFDWLGWRLDKEQRSAADFPRVKALADDMQDWGANLVEIFPPNTFADPRPVRKRRAFRRTRTRCSGRAGTRSTRSSATTWPSSAMPSTSAG